MSATEAAEDLRQLQGTARVGGARPLRWGELPDAIELFTPGVEAGIARIGNLFDWLVDSRIIVPNQRVVLDQATAMLVIGQAMPLIRNVPELLRAIQKFTALVHDRKLEEIAALPMDEGLRLAREAWEVNHDFFTQRMTKILADLWSQAKSRWMPPPVSEDAASDRPSTSSG